MRGGSDAMTTLDASASTTSSIAGSGGMRRPSSTSSRYAVATISV